MRDLKRGSYPYIDNLVLFDVVGGFSRWCGHSFTLAGFPWVQGKGGEQWWRRVRDVRRPFTSIQRRRTSRRLKAGKRTSSIKRALASGDVWNSQNNDHYYVDNATRKTQQRYLALHYIAQHSWRLLTFCDSRVVDRSFDACVRLHLFWHRSCLTSSVTRLVSASALRCAHSKDEEWRNQKKRVWRRGAQQHT